MTTPPPSGTPSPGFDLRIETRLPPDGKPTLELDPGKRHEIVVHIPGGEEPGATVPEAGRATAGMGLPKLGEKWSTSAPTGQGGVVIGVPLPPGRGVTPSVSIAYSTAGGNGPFGWGWRGPVPYFVRTSTKAIVREHGRGLPEYDDAAESDVFAFSDADEVVKIGERIDAQTGAVVVTYRARTEGSFARIERHELGGRSHFVVRSADNVVSIYGLEPETCVTDPNDPARVFQWLLQEQRDCRGNVAVYRYKAEDLAGVDTAAGSERSRGGEQPQRYLKRILYGNRDVPGDAPIAFASLDDEEARARFMFEVVFDYGEHTPGAGAGVDDDHGWPVRKDPFSSGRAGFEVRTRRLCRRVLVFHRFAQLEPGFGPVLVRALELGYEEHAAASRLVSAQLTGYGAEDAITLPPRRFTYSPRAITATTQTIEHGATGGLDLSHASQDAEWFDLDGTGRSGLLTRESGRFVYRAAGDVPASLGAPQTIAFGATPSTDPAVHVQRWIDVSGRGQPALVEFGPSEATVFERDDDGTWHAAQVLGGKTPPVGKDPTAEQHRIYLVDLDGDGITDVLVAKEGAFTWWRRMGAEPGDGWVEQDPIAHDGDEEAGPGSVLFDAARDLAPEGTQRTEAIVFADMTGDGLCDVVRIRGEDIAYWPNLGYGRFGGKVVIGVGPTGPIDPECVRVCDVDGLGPSDLLILAPGGGGTLWLNEAGNHLAIGPTIATPPLAELALSSMGRVDGSLTGSLVWARKEATPAITIVDFVEEPPLLLVGDESGTGLHTTIRYGTSSEHARRCAGAGRPWRTRLPVVIPVVDAVIVEDRVRGTRFSSSYRYAHAHYDSREREFRGFGFVEQTDEETIEGGPRQSAHQSDAPEHTLPASRSRSWFWNGAGVDLRDEYDAFDPDAVILPPPDLGALAEDDAREASRALRGVVLRTESFSDGPGPGGDLDAAKRPIATTSHGWAVRVVQGKGAEHHGCVQPLGEQTLTYTYERQAVPDPRLVQTATVQRDDLGYATRTATVAYPRRAAVPEPGVIEPRDPKPDPGTPRSVLLRLVDFAFETDKSFVLPGAMPGIAVLASQCAAQSQQGGRGEVLVVGHTDRVGADAAHLGISLQRARRVVELLLLDVDGWMTLYDGSMPSTIRWGAHEDALMLAAVGYAGDVRGFQQSVDGLVDDGDLGPVTRRALVQRYMALGGAAVADALPLRAIGAGEAYSIENTGDGVASAVNRRVEAFVFADGIDPPAPEKFLPPDAAEYATWIARVTQQADVDVHSGTVSGTEGVGSVAPPPAEARPEAAVSTGSTDDPQLRTVFMVSEVDLVHQEEPDVHRLGTVIESRSFEVTGKPGDPRSPMSLAALASAAGGGATIPFEQAPSGAHERRLVGRSRTHFYDDGLEKGEFGAVGKRALVAKTLTMAFTKGHAEQVLGPMMVPSRNDDPEGVLKSGGYLNEAGGWWVPSSRPMYSADAFYQPIASIDPFGNLTQEVTYDRDHYLVVRQVTPMAKGLALMSSVSYEYRTFGARGSFDPNGSSTIRRFDALGRVSTEVRRGDPSGGAIEAPEDERAVRPGAFGSEGDDDDAPTVHYSYDDQAFVERGAPCSVTRGVKLEYGKRELRVSLGVTYFDGAGGELQSKVRTEDGRWRASGRTVVNNKGLPVLTYAPFLSGGAGYDPGASQLLARMQYDGLGRLVRTDAMDGTHERVELGAWEVTAYDRNDTVLESDWYAAQSGDSATIAATVAHANTPTTTRLDVLGRPCAVFVRWRDEDGGDVVAVTRQHLDVSGNVVELVDARGNVAERREHGMLGQVLVARSVDAGESRAIADVVGAPLRAVDARGTIAFVEYDVLRRPVEDWISAPGQGEVLVGKRVWGDGANEGAGPRHRGRLVRVYDGGGETRIDAYDLDGNPTEVSRRIVDLPLMLKMAQLEGRAPRARVDWSMLGGCETLAEIDGMLPVLAVLEEKSYRSTARHDAQGRVVEATLPMSGSTHRTRYTEDRLLRWIDRETAGGTSERVYEADDFDHLGRPRTVHQGEAVRTSYAYDPVTERLLRLQSHGAGKALQDLHYAYDPSGNIVRVRDGAQATIVRDNAALEAVNDYRYDALYRLVEATGREHEGQAANGRTPRTNDAQVIPLRASSPNDPKAMRRYVQRFRYDAVGNLRTLQHQAGAGSFRREYAYGEHGNRLRATGNAAVSLHERYEHDVAGHMVAMPHLSRLYWDELGQLEYVQRGTQHVWLQYAGGSRVRKLVFSGEGVVEDRVYLGGEEMFTKRRAGAVVEKTLTEHVGGGLQVDIKLVADGKEIAKPVALRRYALADHLGSTKLEVDADGVVIAYEEFHPYGTTSYRAMRTSLDAAANRYRYTGMERDEETGLAQHGARYYASWLGRWTSADPIGMAGGINPYAYVNGGPIAKNDLLGTHETWRIRGAEPPVHSPVPDGDRERGDGATLDLPSRESFLARVEAVSGEVNVPGLGVSKHRTLKNEFAVSGIRLKSIGEAARVTVAGYLARIVDAGDDAPFLREFEVVARSRGNRLVDPELSLVIALREFGQQALRASGTIDSFEKGGLDHLFKIAPSLKRLGLIPESFTLSEFSPSPSKPGAAYIPRRRVLAFTAAVLGRSRHILEGHVAKFMHGGDSGAAARELDQLTPLQRRIWVAITFGGPYGTTDLESAKPGSTGSMTLVKAFSSAGLPLSAISDLPGSLDAIDPAGATPEALGAMRFLRRAVSFDRYTVAVKAAILATSLED